MVKYKQTPSKDVTGKDVFRYFKDSKMVKESTVPHEVMERFEYTTEVEYDDEPTRRRCLFCDAPKSRGRYLNGETIELCEYHYQNKTLGSIAAQVRLVNSERNKDGPNTKPQAKGKRKQQRRLRQDSIALNYTG